jgi:hypothetical protein
MWELNVKKFTQTEACISITKQLITTNSRHQCWWSTNRTGESNKGRVACYLTRQSSFVKFIRRNPAHCGGKAVADKIWIAGAIQWLCGHRLSKWWGAVVTVRSWGESDAASLDNRSNSSHCSRKREGDTTHRKRRSLCSRTSWIHKKKLLMTSEFNFRFKIIMYIN